MTKFEAGKEYKTRDGSRARIYATDGRGPWPIHGAIFENEGDGWVMNSWSSEGKVGLDSEARRGDLMPPVREWWIVAGEAWDNEAECRDAAKMLHNGPEIIHVREVTDE